MSALRADGFPESEVRHRARAGASAAFPRGADYGAALFGGGAVQRAAADLLDLARLVPPVFMPQRLEKLVDLGREPLYSDVELAADIGGLRSPLPVYLSAFGSTRAASAEVGEAVSRQAGRLGLPMVIGENVVAHGGYGRTDATERSMLRRLRAYGEALPDGLGGVAVQQSTEDADAEVWNLVYSDPSALPLLESGRLAFELKVGQGAKPGLGGMTLVDPDTAARLREHYPLEPVHGTGALLRSSSPGTYTEEILRQQIRLMRNNFPRARVWVKLPPARDVAAASALAWQAGADAVTVDGAEGGTGWAPNAFLDHVGLPLGECLLRIGRGGGALLASGRMWEGARCVKALALGCRAVGLGRAALLATDEDRADGLKRFVQCLALEMRLLISALGRYAPGDLASEDVWLPHDLRSPAAPADAEAVRRP
ncbi:glutamate synthase-related protein [Streptomyces phaeochromogenes]|uniref:glutamate synthase-related protein n=1 Tax=Streptomyces phaeochromogenes TaxID=1923 RepID=UPI003867E2DC|nr:glutamate synthase-related protein [Streptomyces phaeochromogenes]